jgi:hypothetical protein
VGVDVFNVLNSAAVLTYNKTFVPGGQGLQPIAILTRVSSSWPGKSPFKEA